MKNKLISDILISRLGSWRSNLVFTVFGVSLYLYAILKLNNRNIIQFIEDAPYELLGLSCCSIFIIVFGLRGILLIFTSIFALLHLVASIQGQEVMLRFIGEEYLLFLWIPLFSLCLFILHIIQAKQNSGTEEFEVSMLMDKLDHSLLAVFKIIFLTTLGFATFSKLNFDFFDPNLSCTSIAKELTEYWKIESININKYTAHLIVIGEAICCILILVSRSSGIIFTIFFTLGLASIGPTAFNACAIALSLSFLKNSDKELFMQALTKKWYLWMPLLLILLPISHGLYRGDRPWYQFGIYQSLSLVLFFATFSIWIESVKNLFKSKLGTSKKRRLIPSFAFFENYSKPVKCFLFFVAIITILNGMSPYLGLKYRTSFAMLSNLRVDNNRWNHFIMPSWVYLSKYDPYIRVHEINVLNKKTNKAFQSTHFKKIHQLMYEPGEFKTRILGYLSASIQFDITYAYKGKSHSITNAHINNDLLSFVENLESNNLFQKILFLDQGQPCIH